ncbi:hypothetical protein D3C73_1509380 [compost metagenome]
MLAPQRRVHRLAWVEDFADSLLVGVIQQTPVPVGNEYEGAFMVKMTAYYRMQSALLHEIDGAADHAEKLARCTDDRLENEYNQMAGGRFVG